MGKNKEKHLAQDILVPQQAKWAVGIFGCGLNHPQLLDYMGKLFFFAKS
jgi:hypothetical protein